MKKYFCKFLCIIFLALICTSCEYSLNKNGAAVIFSRSGMMPRCMDEEINENTFNKGELIYFGIYSKEPFDCNIGRFQILKKDLKTQIYGYSLYLARDIELTPGENVSRGAFTLYQDGYYLFRFFKKSAPDVPLVQKVIWVE